jgi:hypothetical protein
MSLFGELSPFQILVSVVALWTGIYTFYKNFIERAKVWAYTGDAISFVKTEVSNIIHLHLRLSLVNKGTKTGVVHRLEVLVTNPYKLQCYFVWGLFYEYKESGSVLTKASDTYPVAVAQKDTKPLFVQFELKPLPEYWSNFWQEGTYEFKILGWVNGKPRQSSPNLKSIPFHILLSPEFSRNLIGVPSVPPIEIHFPIAEWHSVSKDDIASGEK